jgi:YegS/Rv2252/BmrU family lipid kinase
MPAKHMLTVVNPRGGTRRGLAILERVRPVLAQADVELDVRVTEHPGHAREIAKTSNLDGYDGFCVIGGDGTIHEVADGLMIRGQPVSVPLGIIPAGSGNTMHQHLACTDPLEAVRRITVGRTCPLDVARTIMGPRVVYCVDIVGWGAVADINCSAERLRRIGPLRYAVAALWHIVKARRRRARLVLDGATFDDEFLFVIGCNTKFTGKDMKLAPRAEIGDGKIDVVVLRRASRLQMLRLFTKVFDGSHLAMGCVEYHQVRSFAIEAQHGEPLDLDGEITGTAPVRVEMMPGALRLFA